MRFPMENLSNAAPFGSTTLRPICEDADAPRPETEDPTHATSSGDAELLQPAHSCQDTFDAEVVERMTQQLLEAHDALEFFCGVYAAKDQPHIEGLLQTLTYGLHGLEKDIAARNAQGHDVSSEEKARRVLQRLISSTNRRMHKGFPETMSYLFRRPSWYCSHEFVNLHFDALLLQCCSVLCRAGATSAARIDETARVYEQLVTDVASAGEQKQGSKPKGLTAEDYAFRPRQLENFPWYFLVSACTAESSSSAPLKWYTYRDAGREGLLHSCYVRGTVVPSERFPGVPLRLSRSAGLCTDMSIIYTCRRKYRGESRCCSDVCLASPTLPAPVKRRAVLGSS